MNTIKSIYSTISLGYVGVALSIFVCLVLIGLQISYGNIFWILPLFVFIGFILVWLQPLRLTTLVMIVMFTSPGLLGLGSGLIYGINMKTILVFFVLTLLIFRYYLQNQHPVPTNMIIPFGIFVLFHIISYIQGAVSNPYLDFGIGGLMKISRDLIAPLTLYLLVTYAKLNGVWVRKLWYGLISVSIFSASFTCYHWLSGYTDLYNATWHDIRMGNLDTGFFEIFPVTYLLPLNLIVANLIYSRPKGFKLWWRLIAIFLLILGTISTLQRILITAVVISFFMWLIVTTRAKGKTIIIMSVIAIFMFLFSILTPLGVNIIELYDYTFSPRPGSTEIGGINIDSSGRFEKQWPAALEYWRESPLYGIGYGQADIRRWFDLIPMKGVLTPHSVYLGWLAESGIIGFIVGFWFFYKITYALKQSRRSIYKSSLTHEIATGLWCFWLSFLFVGIFCEYFWVSSWVFGFMMLLAAILSLESRQRILAKAVSI